MMLDTCTLTIYPYHIPFFFFNDTATTEIYTLSLHDALPISSAKNCRRESPAGSRRRLAVAREAGLFRAVAVDRKSTRLNSSHLVISYAVFCLKKKNTNTHCTTITYVSRV